MRCLAPSLEAAAALLSERISLTEIASSRYLGGTASVRGGVLALTNLTRNSAGDMTARNSAGSFRLAPRVLPTPYAADAPPAIRVSFAVRVWGGGGVSASGASWSHGDGFSLSYGQVGVCILRVHVHVHVHCCIRCICIRVHGVCMACAWRVHVHLARGPGTRSWRRRCWASSAAVGGCVSRSARAPSRRAARCRGRW